MIRMDSLMRRPSWNTPRVECHWWHIYWHSWIGILLLNCIGQESTSCKCILLSTWTWTYYAATNRPLLGFIWRPRRFLWHGSKLFGRCGCVVCHLARHVNASGTRCLLLHVSLYSYPSPNNCVVSVFIPYISAVEQDIMCVHLSCEFNYPGQQ